MKARGWSIRLRWILYFLSVVLLASACTNPSSPPATQESAGAPAERPDAVSPDNVDSSWKPVFTDSFAGGSPQLTWIPYPFFNQDNLRGGVDPTSPDREEGVGILTNENAGGFAALSYVSDQSLGDFRLETWIYTTVTQADRGPLNGVAFRIDPVNNRYYRFASHFIAEPSLSLAYVGQDVQNFPVTLGTWTGTDIPGGVPTDSGWHKLVVEVIDDKAEVYWDSQKLAGGPLDIDRIPAGYVGVYATVTGGLGLAETKVDGFTVSEPMPKDHVRKETRAISPASNPSATASCVIILPVRYHSR